MVVALKLKKVTSDLMDNKSNAEGNALASGSQRCAFELVAAGQGHCEKDLEENCWA